jgi:hypothetical protein
MSGGKQNSFVSRRQVRLICGRMRNAPLNIYGIGRGIGRSQPSRLVANLQRFTSIVISSERGFRHNFLSYWIGSAV